MNIYCSLRINVNQHLVAVENIVNMKSNIKISDMWILNIEASEQNSYPKILNHFCDIIENYFEELVNLGLSKNDITIWLIFEIEKNEQMNIEFNAELMARLSKNAKAFCISRWLPFCLSVRQFYS